MIPTPASRSIVAGWLGVMRRRLVGVRPRVSWHGNRVVVPALVVDAWIDIGVRVLLRHRFGVRASVDARQGGETVSGEEFELVCGTR